MKTHSAVRGPGAWTMHIIITAPSLFFFFSSSKRTHSTLSFGQNKWLWANTQLLRGMALTWIQSPTQWLHCSRTLEFSFQQNLGCMRKQVEILATKPLKDLTCNNTYILKVSGGLTSWRAVRTRRGFPTLSPHPCSSAMSCRGDSWSRGPMPPWGLGLYSSALTVTPGCALSMKAVYVRREMAESPNPCLVHLFYTTHFCSTAESEWPFVLYLSISQARSLNSLAGGKWLKMRRERQAGWRAARVDIQTFIKLLRTELNENKLKREQHQFRSLAKKFKNCF